MADQLDKAFLQSAQAHGFSPEQAAFMLEHIARRPHTHTSDEIIVDTEDGETLEEFRDALIEEVFDGEGPDGAEEAD